MIFANRWVPVLDERWLDSPTMLAALRRRAALEALADYDQMEVGPERVSRTPEGVTYLVYPVSREIKGLYR